jgi:hypothetical protein
LAFLQQEPFGSFEDFQAARGFFRNENKLWVIATLSLALFAAFLIRRVTACPHFMDCIRKQSVTNRGADKQTDYEDYLCHAPCLSFALILKKIPRPRMDGTHSPTKTPASRFSAPNTPNHRETENKKETKAAINTM